jgi:hypothetical protein
VPYSEKWMKNIHEDFKLNAPPTPPNELETIQSQFITTATVGGGGGGGISSLVNPAATSTPSYVSTPTPTPHQTTQTTTTTTTTRAKSNSVGGGPDGGRSKSNSLSMVGENNDSLSLTHIQAFDWTFTNDYCFSLFLQSVQDLYNQQQQECAAETIYSLKNIIRAPELASFTEKSTKSFPPYSIRPIPTSGINYDVLKNRELPILFYDEIILYEVSRLIIFPFFSSRC